MSSSFFSSVMEFLSTPSARRATRGLSGTIRMTIFLSTPSARRATQAPALQCAAASISIHALREEGDWSRSSPCTARRYFYPRPPRGGRLPQWSQNSLFIFISIHALREEGDVFITATMRTGIGFLSTPSARRATAVQHRQAAAPHYFYPRPPRGGRLKIWVVVSTPKLFLSTPSARRATQQRAGLQQRGRFLSTPSARRATAAG